MVRRLHLTTLVGGAPALRWVAVSELEDPTPFLEGGELLLTTGMRLAEPYENYIGRLVDRGVAGLGFGVGLSHAETPAGLVRAALEAGLPLVEVPRETPFIAIGKVVSELLAAEQYEELSRAFAAQGRLTRAALEGLEAVVERLAREVGGWAVLLDDEGRVRHATAGARVAAVTAELGRLRRGGAWRTAPASLAFSEPGQHVVVQPLGGGARPRAYFGVGSEQPFTPVGHTVINAAGSLLTLAIERGRAQLEAERRVRSAVLELVLAGEVQRAREVLAAIGQELPGEPVTVLAAEAAAIEAAESAGFAVRRGEIVIVLAAAEELTGPVGVSREAAFSGLAGAVEEAERALEAARRDGGRVHFADLAGQGLLSVLDPVASRAFARALLAPLAEYGSRADLVESLRAYLASNGHWDNAAQHLGIHRHTLRYRMRRVAELLGRDLEDAGVRAELWVALAVAAG
ncbi:PucR family transcriptional regulator [Nonomuraea soli]|uniref:Purine catabolism regulator n=1 Tax=Nonomuraea soli TaxID=1032476 RepID=A0A7W0CCM0_9ACTN|nr:PucR family transcriptional regulator [Nonomuraea soli]MBA2888687.1 purine catabolism regulator [Nonomuraea soli]